MASFLSISVSAPPLPVRETITPYKLYNLTLAYKTTLEKLAVWSGSRQSRWMWALGLVKWEDELGPYGHIKDFVLSQEQQCTTSNVLPHPATLIVNLFILVSGSQTCSR